MREELLLFHPLPAHCEDLLESRYVVHRPYDAEDPDKLLDKVAARIRVCITHSLDRQTMGRLPNLELVCKMGIGMDDIDLAEAKRLGIRVAITPNVVNDAVAELAIDMMVAVSRNLLIADRHIRDGKWITDEFPPQRQITGKTAGILGLGRMGKEIAARCQAMKMRVVYCGRRMQENIPYPYYENLAEMAKVADFLIVVVPKTPATFKLVNREVLEALGPHGYVINVSRGEAIDEDALIDMLASGELAGAGLDVFSDEPNVPESLRQLENVILSPHRGVYTHETLDAMFRTLLANIDAHFADDPMPTVLVIDAPRTANRTRPASNEVLQQLAPL